MKEHLIVPIEQTFDELQERRLKEVGFIPDPNRFNGRELEVDQENPHGSEFRGEPIFPYETGQPVPHELVQLPVKKKVPLGY